MLVRLMAIDYRKPTRTAAPVRPAESASRRDLRYWVQQYARLTAQIQAAQVTNTDQWRKEQTSLRPLYNQRAAAAARMASAALALLSEL